MVQSTQIFTGECAELIVIFTRLREHFGRGDRLKEPEDQDHMLDNIYLDTTGMLDSRNFNSIVAQTKPAYWYRNLTSPPPPLDEELQATGGY